MWVEFIVGSLPCHAGFSPGTQVFPSPQKLTFSNSNWTRNPVDKEALCGSATFKSLFIYLSIYLLRGYLIIFVFSMFSPQQRPLLFVLSGRLGRKKKRARGARWEGGRERERESSAML